MISPRRWLKWHKAMKAFSYGYRAWMSSSERRRRSACDQLIAPSCWLSISIIETLMDALDAITEKDPILAKMRQG